MRENSLANRLFYKAIAAIKHHLENISVYYIKCRGDDVEYLRHLGVHIGEHCDIYTHPHNFGTEPWLVEIGSKVTIGGGVQFITHDGSSRLFRERLPGMNPYGNRFGTIIVHDNCFIGNCAILLPGIEIGPDSVVGAGSVVTKSVPPGMIYAGNPAHAIKTLDEYIASYAQRMIPLSATDRDSLRDELTTKLWRAKR